MWTEIAAAAVNAFGNGRGGPLANTAADAVYGPSMLASDSSGWVVNFGDDAGIDLRNDSRGAPSQSQTAPRGGDGSRVGSPHGIGADLSQLLASPHMLILGALVLVLKRK